MVPPFANWSMEVWSSLVLLRLKRRRVRSPYHDVPSITQCPLLLGHAVIIKSDHALARSFCRHRVHDRIKRVERVVGEVHLRHQARQHRWSENREMDVGRTPCIRMVLPWIRPWTNCQETINTFFVRQTATHAQEVGIKRPWPLISFVEVTSSSICLPYFQQSVRHWSASIVEHATRHNNALANRLTASTGVTCKVGILRCNSADSGSRTSQF